MPVTEKVYPYTKSRSTVGLAVVSNSHLSKLERPAIIMGRSDFSISLLKWSRRSPHNGFPVLLNTLGVSKENFIAFQSSEALL